MGLSDIEWTTYTHNIWWGCDEVGDPQEEEGIDPACVGCYARVRAENPYWWGKKTIFPVWGQDVGRRFFEDSHYQEPLKWQSKAERAGIQERVFCMSMGDWAEGRQDQRPLLDRWLWPMIDRTPNLIWLLLTKRPQLANSLVPQKWRDEGWPVNAWPGTTAVNQKWWDIRLPHLMKIPAKRHFVSAEPLMGPIDMGPHRPEWVITGGQSGKIAKPTRPDWFRSLRDQCVANGIPFHHKQNGEFAPGELVEGTRSYPTKQWFDDRWIDCDDDWQTEMDHGEILYRIGKKAAGRLLDGRTWDQFPEAVR